MRIIAGLHKGRRLYTPDWDGVRPTSDRLRETLFNILGPRVAGARMFDGYAGTGAVGLEALSRGASAVVFAERDRRAVALIRKNLALCGIEGRYTIESREVADVLRRLASRSTFDLIFLDPPYDQPPSLEVLEDAARCLDPAGLLVLERATRRPIEVPAALVRARDVRSGDSSLTLCVPSAGLHDHTDHDRGTS